MINNCSLSFKINPYKNQSESPKERSLPSNNTVITDKKFTEAARKHVGRRESDLNNNPHDRLFIP